MITKAEIENLKDQVDKARIVRSLYHINPNQLIAIIEALEVATEAIEIYATETLFEDIPDVTVFAREALEKIYGK